MIRRSLFLSRIARTRRDSSTTSKQQTQTPRIKVGKGDLGNTIRWASTLRAYHAGENELARSAVATATTKARGRSTAADAVEGELVAIAQDYYNNPNALNFHKQVWGGDVHVGLYHLLKGDDAKLEGVERIKHAGVITTNVLLEKALPVTGRSSDGITIMDMGSAHGGTARIAAKEFGCNVVCIDVSREENAVNRELSAAAGLTDKIIIPGERSYFETGLPANSIDAVVSQDSLLHAGTEQYRALKEASRVLKPGALMAFTDLMQSETADPKKLHELYKLVKIDHMATPEAYERWGKEYGMELIEFDNNTPAVPIHYTSIVNVIAARRGTMEGIEDHFLDWMSARYTAWSLAAEMDLIRWGFVVLRKKS